MSALNRLLELLSEQPQSAAGLAAHLGLSPAELAALLAQLKAAGVPLEVTLAATRWPPARPPRR